MSVCSRINTLAWLEHNRQIVSIYKGVFKYIACMLCSLLLLKMKKVAIFGDSHVWRLDAFCNEDLKVPMEVRFFGAGGMKASKPKPGLLKQVKMYGADLVVVSLGGNDITTTSVPKDIVAAVLHIAQDFIDSGVSTILVLEIGERGAFRDGLGYRSFASQRARINQLLGKRELVEVLRLPHIRFPAEFMRDKVHLNEKGLKKLFL
ncbi:uncharacterized protein LOC128221442 [Mya arenaria]|uniref:uncharacterized protein LOC128221442 n=1 Tax=Mya arenaria TaxID=6604 RepID=UPI0022E81992|nr:uncharacterized protein LOC128221442 [Mya arenaria]